MRCVTRVAASTRERATIGILHPGTARKRVGNLRGGRVQVRCEVLRRHPPVARNDLRDTGLERNRIRDAGKRQLVEQDRARVVGDEEARHLLGRMRRPPADDADLAARRGGEVPDRGHGARVARDRNLAAALRIDLLKIEDAVHVRRELPSPPSSRESERSEGKKLWRRAAYPSSVRRFQFGIRPSSAEPIEQRPARGRRARSRSPALRPTARALLARSDIGGLDRGQGCRGRRRLRRSRRLLAAPARDSGSKGHEEREQAHGSHRRDHSKARLTPSARGVRLRGPNGGCSSAG